MRFVSTRGSADPVTFAEAFAAGLAPDGGLYVPEELPQLVPELLAEARERSPGIPGSPTYIRWDARDLPFRAQFEGAVHVSRD